MPVTTKEGLLNHLDKGWKLYFHKTLRRWYVYRGARDRKIVSATLQNLCKQLYRKLRGGREPVPALEVQKKRWQGQPIGDIANDTGLSRGAVYNALEKTPGDTVKSRERLQRVAMEKTFHEVAGEANSHEEEKLDNNNPLNSLIVGGILVGVPLGILSLWFLGNLVTGKLKI